MFFAICMYCISKTVYYNFYGNFISIFYLGSLCYYYYTQWGAHGRRCSSAFAALENYLNC